MTVPVPDNGTLPGTSNTCLPRACLRVATSEELRRLQLRVLSVDRIHDLQQHSRQELRYSLSVSRKLNLALCFLHQSRFRFQMVINAPSPQALFEKWARSIDLQNGTTCLPRPGAIPKRATVHLATSARGLRVTVHTRPSNVEVAACIESHVRSRMVAFGPGVWRLETRVSSPLPPLVTSKSLQHVVARVAPKLARDCHLGESPLRASVSVIARLDAEQFAIAVDAPNEAFRTCLSRKLQNSLRRDNFSRYRQLPSGQFQRYFRIDGDAKASHSVAVERPRRR